MLLLMGSRIATNYSLWHAVQTRDRSQDGDFFYGVLTTGIFCRPGCAARLPKRENVRFYSTIQDAETAGLRACLRCKPLARNASDLQDRLRQICTYIRRNLNDLDALKLSSLSEHFALSPFHFQRTFKAGMGVTPRRYVEALRMQTLKEDLRLGSTVTDAIYSASFSSSSRVYDKTDAQLGMTPSQYRTGGQHVEITHATVPTPLGLLMLGATDRGLCFLEFGDSEEGLLALLREEFPKAMLVAAAYPYSEQLGGWIDRLSTYLAGKSTLGPIPIALHGTAFQTAVWDYLQMIPASTVKTYTEVAAAIGKPSAVRAVASACAANRVALVVPCHRVIRGDGGLGGYRWGVDRKRTLLETERQMANL